MMYSTSKYLKPKQRDLLEAINKNVVVENVEKIEQIKKTVCEQKNHVYDIMVVIVSGSHLFPFRTEKLSPSAPMVLRIAGE